MVGGIMDNIDKIEIRISGISNNMQLFIVPSTMKLYVKGKIKDIDKEWLEKLLSIICKWDYEYVDDSVIDAETFKVRIYTSSGVDEYFGCGKYPNNYPLFINLVKGVYGENK